MPADPCPLCLEPGGEYVWQGPRFRVILAPEADYPGFTRIVWQAHVAEMTDLSSAERDLLMRAVFTAESVMRETLSPDKVNLAAFGNMVPHLHWHIIPRWCDDRHFPDAFWATPRVAAADESGAWTARMQARRARLPAYRRALSAAFDALSIVGMSA